MPIFYQNILDPIPRGGRVKWAHHSKTKPTAQFMRRNICPNSNARADAQKNSDLKSAKWRFELVTSNFRRCHKPLYQTSACTLAQNCEYELCAGCSVSRRWRFKKSIINHFKLEKIRLRGFGCGETNMTQLQRVIYREPCMQIQFWCSELEERLLFDKYVEFQHLGCSASWLDSWPRSFGSDFQSDLHQCDHNFCFRGPNVVGIALGPPAMSRRVD